MRGAQITQIELEKDMAGWARSRLDNRMIANEKKGGANNNPYASAIYREYALPLAEAIEADITKPRPGRNKAHVTLLKGLDPEVVAFLAVRNVLNCMMGNAVEKRADIGAPKAARSVSYKVGKAVYSELLLSLFAEAEPALFYTLANDLGRRFSKSERHKMTVFKRKAKEKGIAFPEWGASGVLQVGSYMIFQLENLGMVETGEPVKRFSYNKVRTEIPIVLTNQCEGMIANIKDRMLEKASYFQPCIEPPMDWTSIDSGGWHTREMQRLQPYAVASKGDWHTFKNADMTLTFGAMNALQRTAWRINKQVLETIEGVRSYRDIGEIVSVSAIEKVSPARPDWWGDEKIEDLPADKQLIARQWKADRRDWQAQKKVAGNRIGRCASAIMTAKKYSEFPAIYFVYSADFRGRMYAQTAGISPQGSDMQKALIQFAEGKPINSPDALRWFCIHGANKYGLDKESLDDRAKWHEERHDQIIAIGASPLDHVDWWSEADCPLQFLAWCFEYKAYHDNPATFVSRLPIAMDGTCNGLQNFSAMLRDEIGGEATNLVPSNAPQDIYRRVADRVTELLEQAHQKPVPEDDGTTEAQKNIAQSMAWNRHRHLWLQFKPNRDTVKRCVMTKPYGSEKHTWGKFIYDYLKAGEAPGFPADEMWGAAHMHADLIWRACNDVIVKANEAMAWLQDASKFIMSGGADAIRWTTPTGFPVAQFCQKLDEKTVVTRLNGSTRLKSLTDTDEVNKQRHRQSIAPNFIHSYDAAHMALVANAGFKGGMSLAMIHDDFGCHAADAERFCQIIRAEFVKMYSECDPLASLAGNYGLTKEPPRRGSLDLERVKQSAYFFS